MTVRTRKIDPVAKQRAVHVHELLEIRPPGAIRLQGELESFLRTRQDVAFQDRQGSTVFPELGGKGLDFRLEPIANSVVASGRGAEPVRCFVDGCTNTLAVNRQVDADADRKGIPAVGDRAESSSAYLVPVEAGSNVRPILPTCQFDGRPITRHFPTERLVLGLA